ncbi:MAG: hypothetical protein JOZ24_04170, partial [Candidatus Eremiobacteraeota bacterium]|nr:hypothetical protein [Candidatus Eremiobacteraeota bacterium]
CLAGFTYTFNGVTTTFSGNGANLAPATKSSATAASVNPFGNGTLLPGVPTNFGVGKGTPTPPVVPLVTTPAPAPSGTQPYEVEVYAIDATGANPVNIVAVTEPLTLLGF